MNSIDQKVVEMKFDNSQFESAVSQTMSTLEKFKSKLNFKDTEKGLDKLGKSTSDYQYTLQDVGQSLANLEKRFGVVGTVGARIFEKLTDSAYGFVTRGINNIVSSITQGGMSRAMNLEQARFQMKGILNDAQKVHDVIYKYILPELQGTPYSLDQAAVVIGQLIASNKKSEEQIRRATRGIAGLAAMTNHSFEDVGNIFTKVAGKGVMMAEELNQLSHYGINAAADLAKFYKGVEKGSYQSTKQTLKDMAAIKEEYGEFTEAVIRDAASKRLISYGSMAAAMDSLYGPHAQKSTQMYTGALEDLKAAMARIGAEPAALKLNLFRDVCNALVPAVDAVNAVIKPLWNSMRNMEGLDPVLEYVAPFTGPLAQKVQKAGWEFQKLFVQLDENNEIVRATRDSYEKLGLEYDKTANIFKDAKTGLEYDEKQALMNPKMLKTITSGTKAFVNTVSALAKVLQTVGRGIKRAFPKVTFDNIVSFTEKIEQFTKTLADKIRESQRELTRLEWFSRGLFTPLGLAIRGVVGAINLLISTIKFLWPVISPIASVFNAFLGMIGRVVSGLGNMIRNFANIIRGNLADTAKEIQGSAKWAKFVEKVVDVCSKLANKLDTAGIKAYAFLSTLHDLPAVQASLSTIHSLVEILKTAFDYVTGSVKNFIGSLGLGDKLASFIQPLKDFLSTNGDKAAGSLSKFGDWIGKFGFYKSAVDLLSGSFTGLIGTMSGLAKFKPLKGLRKWFSELGNIILDLGRSFVEGDFFVDRLKDLGGRFANFKRLGGMLGKGFVPAIKALGDSLPKLLDFKDWGDLLGAISDKIGAAVGFIMKTLGLFGTGVAQDAAKGVENISAMTQNLRATAKDIGNSEYITPLKAFFDKISTSFKDWVQNMDVASAKRLVIGLAYFGTCLYYLNTINSAAKAFRGLTKIAEGIASGVGAFGRMAEAISRLPIALSGAISAVKLVAYMHAVAISLIGIAAAMFIISKIDPNRLAASAGIAAGALVVVAGLMWSINAVSNKLGPDTAKTMLTVAGVIGTLAAAVLAIAGSLYLLTTIEDPTALQNAVNSIANIIFIFGVVMAALAFVPAFGKGDSGASKAYGNVGAAAWALVGIAAGIRTMVEAIRQLADMYQNGDEKAIKKAVDLVNQLIVLTGVFGLLAGWGGHGFSAGMAIIPMALGLKLIIGSLVDLASTLTDAASLSRAMTALEGLGDFVSNLGWLFIAIGAMNAMSGLISKGDFILGGKSQIGAAMLAIAEVIAGVYVVAQSMLQLGTLTDAQIENGIRVLKAFGTLAVVLGGLSFLGGKGLAAGVGAFAALGAGLFLLAEGIIALGETQHFAEGFGRMGVALLGLIGSVVLATKLISTFMTVKQAASIAILSAAMLGFALSIRMMAECPWESLMFAVVGLVGIMAIAAGLMTAFAAGGVALLPIAGVFALLGVAALGLGAGIFLLTLALSALIPLIIGLGGIPMDQLQQGLTVLKEAATGLTETFGILAGGIFKVASALVTLGVSLIIVGIGGAVLAVGILAVSAAVFIFAGSLMVLYEVLANFFPSVVKPMEDGMSQIIDTFTRGLLDPTVNTVSKAEDEVNNVIEEKGDEGVAIAEEKSEEIAEKMNFFELMKQNGFEGSMEDFIEMTGGVPIGMGNAWDANSGEFTGAVDGTIGDANDILQQFGTGNYEVGFGGISQLASGVTDASGLPVNAHSNLLSKLVSLHQKHEEHMQRAGEAQVQKMYAGMKSKEDLVEGEAKTLEKKGTPSSKYDDAYKVGSGIASGLAAGIRSGADAVKGAAESAVDAAIAAAKKTADVNSPSKRTIPIGSAIGEGLVVGMKNIAGEVITSARNLAEGGINSLTNAMQKSAAAFDADLDFNPTITPVVDLTNVDQSINQMGSMFNSAFGITTPFGGTSAALAARSFYDSRNQNARDSELNKLANSINGMTDTMNSRSLNNYITIDGSSDPEAFADGLIRSFRLNARTV